MDYVPYFYEYRDLCFCEQYEYVVCTTVRVHVQYNYLIEGLPSFAKSFCDN